MHADGLSRLTWESATSAEQDGDAVLINSVNIEPLSRESMKAALKQDPVLSQVVDWLKTGVKLARCDVEEVGANFCHTGHIGEDCCSGMVWCQDAGKTNRQAKRTTSRFVCQKALCLKCCMSFIIVLQPVTSMCQKL